MSIGDETSVGKRMRTAVLMVSVAVLLFPLLARGAAAPLLEVRAWLYDTQNTPDRSDDVVLDPEGSGLDYYVETGLDGTGGVNNPALLHSGSKIWDVYSNNLNVYRLVFQFQCDQADLVYDCDLEGKAYWMVWSRDGYWSPLNVPGRKELILTREYNDQNNDPDMITDYESGWWSDPKDMGLPNAPDSTKDITEIDADWRLECVDALRNWELDAYEGKNTLYCDTDSTLVWEMHFMADDDWTDNENIEIQLHMGGKPWGHSTDIRFRIHTTSPVLKWCYPDTGSIGLVTSSPTVRGGRVYVGCDDKKLYCLDASSGSLIWTYEAGGPIRSSPSVKAESGGMVAYFGADDGYVYAVRDAGSGSEEKWKASVGAVLRSSPAVLDTLLYIGCNDSSLHCLRTSDGSEKWATDLLAPVRSSPAVFIDVYIGSDSGTLYAVNALDGTLLRMYLTCGELVAPVFLTWTNGQICIGSYKATAPVADTLYVINASNFQSTWKFADGGSLARTWGSCFSMNDTTVYFGNNNDFLYCVDIWDQSLVYRYPAGDDVRSSPLWWDGIVYFGSNDDRFYALDDATQWLMPNWPFVANDDIESSPAISITDSIVVVGSSDGHVYGFYME